jgi:hypothetical protein
MSFVLPGPSSGDIIWGRSRCLGLRGNAQNDINIDQGIVICIRRPWNILQKAVIVHGVNRANLGAKMLGPAVA